MAPLPASDREFLSAFLPINDDGAIPPLPVGDTPLLEAPRLRDELEMPNLFLKDDTRNPSGSTKDRASLLVVAKAVEYGCDTVATASTGNAASALAAVAASAGLRAIVLVPAAAPPAKLAQMQSYGAVVVPVDGNYDQAFELCTSACNEFGWYNRSTALNPFTIEGKKTAALEIAAAITPDSPDAILVPTGDGVILAGLAKGFRDLERAEPHRSPPPPHRGPTGGLIGDRECRAIRRGESLGDARRSQRRRQPHRRDAAQCDWLSG